MLQSGRSLLRINTPIIIGAVFASVAGIMVFISFDELLPMAERWGHHHISIMGIIAGMPVSYTPLDVYKRQERD